MAALSLDEGIIAAMTLTGAVDNIAFETYIQQVLCPHLRSGKIAVMDQLAVHKNAEVRKAIAAQGCELVFLPNHSPDLNPIEQAQNLR